MQHGGDIYTEGILKGKEIIDFSSNINPLGIPESFKENIEEALDNLSKYPDAQYRNLKVYLKDYINNYKSIFSDENNETNELINEENIILGNGAAEIIDLIISSFKSIMIPVPSFGEYEEDSKKWGLNIVHINCREDMDYDYDAILNNLEKVDALILGNPNNPDGKIIDKDKFKDIIDYCEKNNKKIIIDEAFIEFVGDPKNSFIDYIKDYKCIFIIKALTKFYAMPGIRLGFGITNDKVLLKNMRKKQNPWNINSFAEIAAKYVLKDTQYIKESLEWIKNEKVFFIDLLKEISFIEKVFKTHSNFVLCKLNKLNCDKLYNLCLEKGIAIRKCDNFIGLDKSYVRFAIKDRVKNILLINILKKL